MKRSFMKIDIRTAGMTGSEKDRNDEGYRNMRGKKKYGFFGNLAYHYRRQFRWMPGLFWAGLLIVIPEIGLQLGTVEITRFFVQGIEEKMPAGRYFGTMAVLGLGLVLLEFFRCWLWAYCDSAVPEYQVRYENEVLRKQMAVDYEVLESQEFQNAAKNAEQEIDRNGGIFRAVQIVQNFLIGLAGCAAVIPALLRLSIWMVAIPVLMALAEYGMLYLSRKSEEREKERLSGAFREAEYVVNASGDISMGKDIRLFGMQDWFVSIHQKAFARMKQAYWKIWNWYYASNVVRTVFVLIRDGYMLGFLVWRIYQGGLSISDFVYYTGLVAALDGWIWKMEENFHDLGMVSWCFACIRKFQDMGDRQDPMNTGLASLLSAKPLTIEFQHVCYRYPGAKEDTIHDLNLTIRAGENLALVGLNGAGKTTFVKLLCRLYHVTGGEILVGGVPIETLGREEYASLLSVLFQDIAFLPVSVEENIACEEETQLDRGRLERSLHSAGIWKQIWELPQKGKTPMVAEARDGAVDFSGGQRQKLLLARAIYRDAPILILDEPTAALDPIAEQEIYLHYGEIAEGKTTVFISHRLSSTRFCDRIILLENGKIAEEGTHEELLAAGGRYASLFELQSRYYREEKGGNV